MSEYVLDASAVLTVIHEEAGSDEIEPYLRTAPISAVNVAEVVTKLQDSGFIDAEIDEALTLLGLDIRPFNEPDAVLAGKLRGSTRQAGLSLGDRACLALAHTLDATALTTDRAWSSLDIGIPVKLAR